jgi:hypothetical protein
MTGDSSSIMAIAIQNQHNTEVKLNLSLTILTLRDIISHSPPAAGSQHVTSSSKNKTG